MIKTHKIILILRYTCDMLTNNITKDMECFTGYFDNENI
jgi:hypothetical protein